MQNFLKVITGGLKSIEGGINFVPASVHAEIIGLQTELSANGGIMPPAWLPFANLLIAILTVVSIFVNITDKTIIAVIIAAIRAAEEA